MKIIVCIKQAPASSDVQIDPITGVLVRDGKNVKMNPYDLFALEMAFEMKEKMGAEVHAITMGPPSATSVLKEAIYMGADGGTIISDRKFAGADEQTALYYLKRYNSVKYAIFGIMSKIEDEETIDKILLEHKGNIRESLKRYK